MPKHLIKRGDVYYANLQVPKDVQQLRDAALELEDRVLVRFIDIAQWTEHETG